MERYLYIFIISIFFLCICLVCNGCMNLYDRFSVGNDVSGINISKELTLSSSGIGFNCVKPSPPPSPTPAPAPAGSGETICIEGELPEDSLPPLKIPDVSGSGIFVVQNNHKDNKNIIVWFDKEHPFLTPLINYNNPLLININENAGSNSYGGPITDSVLSRKRGDSGFLLKKNEQLYWNLKGTNTHAPSFGVFVSSDNVNVNATVNGTNRIEASFIGNPIGGQLWWNISQVDGYNSSLDVYYNINGNIIQSFGNDVRKCCGNTKNKCNLILNKNKCNENGGKYLSSELNNASFTSGIRSGTGIPVCRAPSKRVMAYESGIDGILWKNSIEIESPWNTRSDTQILSQPWTAGTPLPSLYPLARNPSQKINGIEIKYNIENSGYDPVGCNNKAQTNRYTNGDNDYNDLCSCYEAWNSEPSSISEDLNKWNKYIKTNCKASYSWAFGEGYPTNDVSIRTKYNFPNKGWCMNALTDIIDCDTPDCKDITKIISSQKIKEGAPPESRYNSQWQSHVLNKLQKTGLFEEGRALTSCESPVNDKPIFVISVTDVLE